MCGGGRGRGRGQWAWGHGAVRGRVCREGVGGRCMGDRCMGDRCMGRLISVPVENKGVWGFVLLCLVYLFIYLFIYS